MSNSVEFFIYSALILLGVGVGVVIRGESNSTIELRQAKCLSMQSNQYKHRKYTGSYEMLTNGLHCLDTNGSLHKYKQTTGE